ncbi:MAG TPA: hypothetical protein VGJ00_04965 [Rhabdochlamydiaceae bacterium]|jgi:hypothetical protein
MDLHVGPKDTGLHMGNEAAHLCDKGVVEFFCYFSRKLLQPPFVMEPTQASSTITLASLTR